MARPRCFSWRPLFAGSIKRELHVGTQFCGRKEKAAHLQKCRRRSLRARETLEKMDFSTTNISEHVHCGPTRNASRERERERESKRRTEGWSRTNFDSLSLSLSLDAFLVGPQWTC